MSDAGLEALAAEVEALELAVEVELRLADALAGSVPVGVARALHPWEIRARVDFAGVDADAKAAASRLTAILRGNRDRLIELIEDDLAESRRNELDDPTRALMRRIDAYTDPSIRRLPPGAHDLLARTTATMVDELVLTAQTAAARVQAEAIAQGIPVRQAVGALAAEELDRINLAVGRAVRDELDRVVREFRDQAYRLPVYELGAGPALERMGAAARALSTQGLEGLASSGANNAVSLGRAAASRDLPAPRFVYASELLDGNTCGPCSLVDGREYGSIEAARVDYPEGRYRDCQGGERCRGTLVYVWDTETEPTGFVPGDRPEPGAGTPGGPPVPGVPPAPAAPRPGGVEAGSVLESLPRGRSGHAKRVADGVGQGIAAIERVHRVPDGMRTVPVLQGASRSAQGQYEFAGPSPVNIRISTSSDHAAGTFAHEYGHYLDHQGGWSRSAPGSPHFEQWGTRGALRPSGGTPDPLWEDWHRAVTSSPTWQALRELKGSPRFRSGSIVNYYMRTDEAWARSYAQWIAHRSGDADMVADFARMVDNRANNGAYGLSQWPPEEFEPIAKALDAIFRARGLLK